MNISAVLDRLGFLEGETQDPCSSMLTYETMVASWRHTTLPPPTEEQMLFEWNIYLEELAVVQYLKDRDDAIALQIPTLKHITVVLEQWASEKRDGKVLCPELNECVEIYTKIIEEYPGPPLLVDFLVLNGTQVNLECFVLHGIVQGDSIVVVGANEPEYNGTFLVDAVDNRALLYTIPLLAGQIPASPATGVITVVKIP